MICEIPKRIGERSIRENDQKEIQKFLVIFFISQKIKSIKKALKKRKGRRKDLYKDSTFNILLISFCGFFSQKRVMPDTRAVDMPGLSLSTVLDQFLGLRLCQYV